jgi:hypothetical protein
VQGCEFFSARLDWKTKTRAGSEFPKQSQTSKSNLKSLATSISNTAIMSSKKGAYDTTASDTDFRKKYDAQSMPKKQRNANPKRKKKGNSATKPSSPAKNTMLPSRAMKLLHKPVPHGSTSLAMLGK